MRSDYAGKTVTLRLTPVYKTVRFKDPQFLLIQHGDLLNLIVLPEDKYYLAAAVAVLAAGLFLAIGSLFLKIDNRTKQRLFYLGAFSFCAGTWKLANLQFTALFLDIYGLHKEIWYLGATAWLMLPVLFNQFSFSFQPCDDSIGRPCRRNFSFLSPKRSAAGYRWICINALLLLAVILLQAVNAADLYETMFFFSMICVLGELFVLFCERPERKELLWLITFPAALAADTAIWYISGSSRRAIAVLAWAAFNLCFRAAGFISEAISRERLLYLREEELRDAKIRTIMQQIHPHFIYNTLTSVYVLCREDPKQAMDVIENFTAYLQSNFSAISAKELISFPDELRHTKAYLAVEAIRYGEKLTVEYDLKHTAFRLPPLTLQPVIENAVKYGVGAGHYPEHIRVRTYMEDNASVITVEDDGPGFDTSFIDEESHIGLRNVRERLELMCGGQLEIESAPDRGTLVTVTIPNRD